MKQSAAMRESSGSTQATVKPRRVTWWQFRLRTLLVMATIASVVFATVGVHWQRRRSMMRSIAALNAHGAVTGFVPARQGWLPESLALPDLLLVNSQSVPGVPLELLTDFSTVDFLVAPGVKISPAGLQAVAQQKKLSYLDLSNSSIGDDDLKSLIPLTELRMLDLSGTQVTDAGMRYIAELASLEYLHLDRTAVTDDAVESLRHLPRLQTLTVAGSGMTEQGLQTLESSIEGLMVLDD